MAKTTKEATTMFVAILVIIWFFLLIMNLLLLKTKITVNHPKILIKDIVFTVLYGWEDI